MCVCVCVFTGLDGVFANTCEPHILSFVPPVVLAHLDTHTHTLTNNSSFCWKCSGFDWLFGCFSFPSWCDSSLSVFVYVCVCVCVCVLKDYNQPPLCVFTCVSLFPTKSAVKAVAFILVSPVTSWSCRTVTYCTIYVN